MKNKGEGEKKEEKETNVVRPWRRSSALFYKYEGATSKTKQ